MMEAAMMTGRGCIMFEKSGLSDAILCIKIRKITFFLSLRGAISWCKAAYARYLRRNAEVSFSTGVRFFLFVMCSQILGGEGVCFHTVVG